jgi:biotin carboxylase
VGRILLLLPTWAYRAEDFLAAARRVGAEVIVASDRGQALADLMGSRALALPYGDPPRAAERIAELAAEHPLDAVVPVDDKGVVIAALAAERLGLPHNPIAAAKAATDKAQMRRRFEAAGVPQPPFRVLDSGEDVAVAAREIGPPVVVKPLSLAASRGVIRADSPAQAREAAERIRRILAGAGEDPGGRLIIERFIPGEEVALEGLLVSGRLEVLAIFDKPDPLEGPFFEETIYVTPSRLPPATREKVVALTEDATEALGLREGPIHAEARVAADRVTMLEIAARSIGGLCARTLRFGAGISLEEVILRHALGGDPGDLLPASAASGVMMLPIPGEGTLVEVRGRKEAAAIPGIEGISITVPPGQRVIPIPEGDRYLGFLFARHQSPEEVEQALREAHARLEIVIHPSS